MPYIGKRDLSESELLENFSNKDEQAFGEIYTRYWQRLYVFALSKLGDEATSEEVVQNVFIDVWMKRGTGQVENLSAYLYRAVKFKCIDQIRQRLVRSRYEELVIADNSDEDLSTEELLAFQELRSAITAGMEHLPEKTREIFRLNRLESLTIREVSLKLSIPERTVEHHISQALKIMRTYLRDFIVMVLMLLS